MVGPTRKNSASTGSVLTVSSFSCTIVDLAILGYHRHDLVYPPKVMDRIPNLESFLGAMSRLEMSNHYH